MADPQVSPCAVCHYQSDTGCKYWRCPVRLAKDGQSTPDPQAFEILARSVGVGMISRRDQQRIAEIAEGLPPQPNAVSDTLGRLALAVELWAVETGA